MAVISQWIPSVIQTFCEKVVQTSSTCFSKQLSALFQQTIVFSLSLPSLSRSILLGLCVPQKMGKGLCDSIQKLDYMIHFCVYNWYIYDSFTFVMVFSPAPLFRMALLSHETILPLYSVTQQYISISFQEQGESYGVCFGVLGGFFFFGCFQIICGLHISKSLGQMQVSWEKKPTSTYSASVFLKLIKTVISPSLIIITACFQVNRLFLSQPTRFTFSSCYLLPTRLGASELLPGTQLLAGVKQWSLAGAGIPLVWLVQFEQLLWMSQGWKWLQCLALKLEWLSYLSPLQFCPKVGQNFDRIWRTKTSKNLVIKLM